MYVAVKGGERAIRNAHALLAERRRGNRDTPELTPAQIDEQLALAVDRVMSEGSLYDRGIAALAIKQARGDLIEAIFLVRAYRTTLARFGFAESLDTAAMTLSRRVSATFKDLPGGQVLGPTFDYSHRLIDFNLESHGARAAPAASAAPAGPQHPSPRVTDLIARDDLIEREIAPARVAPVSDITRDALAFPAQRDARLQNPGARRRRLPARARLLVAARIRPHASVRRRDPFRRGGGRILCRGPRICRFDRRH